LVAQERGRVIGMMQAGPDRRYRDTATIGLAGVLPAARSRGVGRALLSGVVEWAQARGFRACAVEWSSPNLISDRFWRRHGFDPVHYQLTRRIDPRVAWANPHFDYQYFTQAPPN
jgi:GNAT superfamily N-acetyltransferase